MVEFKKRTKKKDKRKNLLIKKILKAKKMPQQIKPSLDYRKPIEVLTLEKLKGKRSLTGLQDFQLKDLFSQRLAFKEGNLERSTQYNTNFRFDKNRNQYLDFINNKLNDLDFDVLTLQSQPNTLFKEYLTAQKEQSGIGKVGNKFVDKQLINPITEETKTQDFMMGEEIPEAYGEKIQETNERLQREKEAFEKEQQQVLTSLQKNEDDIFKDKQIKSSDISRGNQALRNLMTKITKQNSVDVNKLNQVITNIEKLTGEDFTSLKIEGTPQARLTGTPYKKYQESRLEIMRSKIPYLEEKATNIMKQMSP